MINALIEISDQIGVAGITTIGLVIVAIIQNQRTDRKANKAAAHAAEAKEAAELTALHADARAEELKTVVSENIGRPNGNGNVIEMLERIDNRTSVMAGQVDQQDKRIMDLRMALEEHTKRYHPDPPQYVEPPRHVAPPGRVRPLRRREPRS